MQWSIWCRGQAEVGDQGVFSDFNPSPNPEFWVRAGVRVGFGLRVVVRVGVRVAVRVGVWVMVRARVGVRVGHCNWAVRLQRGCCMWRLAVTVTAATALKRKREKKKRKEKEGKGREEKRRDSNTTAFFYF